MISRLIVTASALRKDGELQNESGETIQRTIIGYFLIVLLFIVYFKVSAFLWSFLRLGELTGGIGVLFGTLLILVLSFVFAKITSDKLIEALNRR